MNTSSTTTLACSLVAQGVQHLAQGTKDKGLLLENGLLDQVETAINAIEDVAVKTRMQIEYSESVVFERASPTILQMCGLLSLTSEQADVIWSQALTL